MFDVIIVGGSFAGLAVAMQLRGFKVLVIDQRPIGTHQTSTCAIPQATAQLVGASDATLEVHEGLSFHTGRREFNYKLPEPYVTFDYYAFCQAMLAQTNVEVWVARATNYQDGTVMTPRGPVSARFVVDASGWRSLRREQSPREERRMGGRRTETPVLGYGMETELPVRLPLRPGLHFYFEKRVVRNGYAWVFPCGESSRIGLCSFDKGVQLRPVLDTFLERFGLQRTKDGGGNTHGGAMPIVRREPISGDLFIVGDAAGQCLPIWAEGIRSAIFYSIECGRAIADALNGVISADEARARYAGLAKRTERFQHKLLALHNLVAWSPEWWRAAVFGTISRLGVADPLVKLYLRKSGWPQAVSPSPQHMPEMSEA